MSEWESPFSVFRGTIVRISKALSSLGMKVHAAAGGGLLWSTLNTRGAHLEGHDVT